MRAIDIAGMRFTKLEVIGYVGLRKGQKNNWECRCDCGQITYATGSQLRKGRRKSCGCMEVSGQVTDLTGQKFNRWTVKAYDGDQYWFCQCECGTQQRIFGPSLTLGRSKSCGCYKRENARRKGQNSTHGLSKSRFYRIYQSMIYRCENPITNGYHNYGGRGIKVSETWRERFENFMDDMYAAYLDHSKKHGESNTTLERKDSDKDYSKENCRWATVIEQHNNTRINLYIVYNNEKLSLADLCRKYGVRYSFALYRIKNGWSMDEVINGRRSV